MTRHTKARSIEKRLIRPNQKPNQNLNKTYYRAKIGPKTLSSSRAYHRNPSPPSQTRGWPNPSHPCPKRSHCIITNAPPPTPQVSLYHRQHRTTANIEPISHLCLTTTVHLHRNFTYPRHTRVAVWEKKKQISKKLNDRERNPNWESGDPQNPSGNTCH